MCRGRPSREDVSLILERWLNCPDGLGIKVQVARWYQQRSLCSEDLSPAGFMAGPLQGRLGTEQELKAWTTAAEMSAETVFFPSDRHSPRFTLTLHFDGSSVCSL